MLFFFSHTNPFELDHSFSWLQLHPILVHQLNRLPKDSTSPTKASTTNIRYMSVENLVSARKEMPKLVETAKRQSRRKKGIMVEASQVMKDLLIGTWTNDCCRLLILWMPSKVDQTTLFSSNWQQKKPYLEGSSEALFSDGKESRRRILRRRWKGWGSVKKSSNLLSP